MSRGTVGLALGGAAASGVPLGLQLAAALVRDPASAGHAVVPLLLAGPEITHEVINTPVSYIDLVPTLLAAAQTEPSD